MASAIEALEVRDSIGSKTLTFTDSANHLAAQVSILPEFVSKDRGIGGVKRYHGAKHTGDKGIYKKDGSVYTGFYKNWGGKSQEDKIKVIDKSYHLEINKAIPKKANYRKKAAASNMKALDTLKKDTKEAKLMI